MRIYQLYDALTSFEFSLRYFKDKEYLVLDESSASDSIKMSEFKLNNFYICQQFLDEKLSELLKLLKCLREYLETNIKNLEGEYYHKYFFKKLFREWSNLGINITIDPLLDGNTKVLYYLSDDLKNEVDTRVDLVENIIAGSDYIFHNINGAEINISNDLMKRHISVSGEIKPRAWKELKQNKYPELSQTNDYKTFFNKQGLIQFDILRENINEKWRKDKFAMFIKVLDIKGYFKEDLTVDLMIKFATLLTKRKFYLKDFDEAVKYKDKWIDVYGGFEITTVR